MSGITSPIKFLGASVVNFNINIGWANQATTLTTTLVQDDLNGDVFSGGLGALERFQVGGWWFDGIVTNYKKQNNSSANPTYEIVLSDPRQFLSGIQLVIGSYTGFTYGIPNLYNIYGYYESIAFGNSGVNESGMPWQNVRDGFITLAATTPPQLGSTPFLFDFSELPSIPAGFRIGGNNISLMDFIQQVCETANHDFTILMTGNVIKVVTIDRNVPLLSGSIEAFISGLSQHSGSEIGQELLFNPTNKFIVGGQKEELYFQFFDVSSGIYSGLSQSDVTIARYWGKNKATQDVIISDKINIPISGIQQYNEQFAIDASAISFTGNVFAQYQTDTEELRAALDSYDSWETFIERYRSKDNRGRTLLVDPIVSGSIHYGKFEQLNMFSNIKTKGIIGVNINNVHPKDLVTFERNTNLKDQADQFVQKVYEFISSYANEYMDRKFMVRIPSVSAKLEPDGSLKTSVEPVNAAYLEESLIPTAVANNLLPNDPLFAFTEDSKTECFVRFGPFSYEDLDLSELPEDSYVINGNYVFVKASVEPELVFLDRSSVSSPRAVITLPGRMKLLDNDNAGYLDLLGYQYISSQPPAFIPRATADFNRWKNRVASDPVFQQRQNYGLIPEMAAIPLKSNTDTYGPWYTSGLSGIVEFEQDYDLVPWNFGGYTNMNNAGQALIQLSSINNIFAENGTVEAPGTPNYDLASTIVSGGPIISQISVNISTQGVQTTYRMEKWNQTYDKQIRYRIEQFKKEHQNRREYLRRFNELFNNNKDNFANKFGQVRFRPSFIKYPKRKVRSSTHPMLMSTSFLTNDSPSGQVMTYSIGTMPYYQVPDVLDTEDWRSVAGSSLDALFSPFDTNPESYSSQSGYSSESGYFPPGYSGGVGYYDYMPRFELPSGSSTINSTTLNPFKTNHSIGVAVYGDSISGHTDINLRSGSTNVINSGVVEEITYGPSSGDNYRGVGLRLPLVAAGWGFDTNDNPVPAKSDDETQFHPDYLKDPTLWKAGPIDLRWDDERKVWTINGGGTEFFKLLEDMPVGHGTKALANFYDWDGNVVKKEYLFNWGDPETGDSPQGLIDSVIAGYWGTSELHRGRQRFEQGPCADNFRCASNGNISGDPSDGILGSGYNYSFSVSNLNSGTFTIAGLPSGLNYTQSGLVSGVPGAAGTFELTLTGTSEKSGGGACPLTRIRYLTINEV